MAIAQAASIAARSHRFLHTVNRMASRP